MADAKVPLDRLAGDILEAIEKLRVNHRYWEVRIYGSDDQARVEIIVQQKTKYDLSPKRELSK